MYMWIINVINRVKTCPLHKEKLIKIRFMTLRHEKSECKKGNGSFLSVINPHLQNPTP